MPVEQTIPKAAELEISLFGPGTGESIVIHLGEGKWMIVDSCQPASYEKPVAIQYLEGLGLDPAVCVVAIVITHFHSDHIKGMDSIVEQCRKADVWISDALCVKESISFVLAHSIDEMITDKDMQTTKEATKILRSFDANDISIRRAIEARPIYMSGTTKVTALSPSDAAVNQSQLDFAKAFEELGTGYKKLAKKLCPNKCAVVLLIEYEESAVLLGADMEISDSVNLGWEAVVSCKERPQRKARIFKVAHHGSITGHYDPVYDLMLEEKPTSLLTTMDTHSLPLERDVERICSRASDVYCATQPKFKLPKRDKVVQNALDQFVKSRKVVGKGVGHIQLRLDSNGQKRVNLDQNSKILQEA